MNNTPLISPIEIRRAIGALFSPKTVALLTLSLIAFMLALAVIEVKDQYRQHFIHLEQLKAEYLQLETEWSELLLEESTWSSRTRVSSLASGKLGMIPLDPSQIRMLTPEQLEAG